MLAHGARTAHEGGSPGSDRPHYTGDVTRSVARLPHTVVGSRLYTMLHDPATFRAWTVDINDGIIATAGLLEGFARAGASDRGVITAGVVATLAGALALGGTRWAERAGERDAQVHMLHPDHSGPTLEPEQEHAWVAEHYQARGLSPDLARTVADQLLAHDRARTRLEISFGTTQPVTQAVAAWESLDAALAFIVGSTIPLLISIFMPGRIDLWATIAVVVGSLTLTSIAAARHHGASVWRTVVRSVAVGIASVSVSYLAGSIAIL